jgi:hypothetical protein
MNWYGLLAQRTKLMEADQKLDTQELYRAVCQLVGRAPMQMSDDSYVTLLDAKPLLAYAEEPCLRVCSWQEKVCHGLRVKAISLHPRIGTGWASLDIPDWSLTNPDGEPLATVVNRMVCARMDLARKLGTLQPMGVLTHAFST